MRKTDTYFNTPLTNSKAMSGMSGMSGLSETEGDFPQQGESEYF